MWNVDGCVWKENLTVGNGVKGKENGELWANKR